MTTAVSSPGPARPGRNRRFLWLTVSLAILLVAVVGIVYYIGNGQQAASPVGGAVPSYPLQVSPDHRFLVDQNNTAQFIAADTAWNIFTRLDDAEVAQYLDARKAQGFNTVLTSVVDISAGGIAGANRNGDRPFINGFGNPNPAYFDHVDTVLKLAADRGMQLVVVPAWLSLARSEPSYTAENAKTYGAWLGNRYRGTDNLMWMTGGDWGSPTDSAVGACPRAAETEALAGGIKSADPRHLMTYHPGVGLASSTCFNDSSWLDVNSNYWDFNDQNVSSAYRFMYRDYPNTPTRPTIMIETGYEGPFPTDSIPDALTAATSRMQSYFMALSGSPGFTYGANQTYAMVNECNPNASRTWQETLTIPGGFQQGYIAELFATMDWWKLVPDENHTTFVDGWGSFGEENYLTAGRASDGTFALAYVPTPRTVTVDMSRLAGPVTAQWFDPTNSSYIDAGSGLPNTGTHEFAPPAQNSGDDPDFVLVLKSAS